MTIGGFDEPLGIVHIPEIDKAIPTVFARFGILDKVTLLYGPPLGESGVHITGLITTSPKPKHSNAPIGCFDLVVIRLSFVRISRQNDGRSIADSVVIPGDHTELGFLQALKFLIQVHHSWSRRG